MNQPSATALIPSNTRHPPESSPSILGRYGDSSTFQSFSAGALKGTNYEPLHIPRANDAFGVLAQKITALAAQPSPSQLDFEADAHSHTLEEQLFEATAGAKILVSRVAMHLDTALRRKLFDQLDSLHDIENWENGDIPLQQESFSTFLKTLFLLRPTIRPGLGLSIRGHLVATWRKGENRLTIEFLPKEKVLWVATISSNGDFEHTASEMPIAKLRERLKPFAEEGWIGK